MHYHAEIWIPTDTDYQTQVEDIMLPYCEDHSRDGFWDWYQIGGRWTGAHMPDYDPEKDPRNIENCCYCSGTGKRSWSDGVKPCNACAHVDESGVVSYPYGVGRCLKWPSEWAAFALDVCPVDAIPDDFTCYTLIAQGVAYKSTEYLRDEQFPDCFRDTEFKSATVRQWLRDRLSIDAGYLVTVDYHS